MVTVALFKKRFPKLWKTVEKNVRWDTEQHLVSMEGMTRSQAKKISKIISHNAAFYACAARMEEVRLESTN